MIRYIVLLTITLLLTVSCSGASKAETAQIPPTAPTAAPTPTFDVEEKIEELYWIQVDFVVEQLKGIPGVSRKLGFDFLMGHMMLVLELSMLHEENIEELENNGINPFYTKPFCLDVITGLWLLVEMTQQQTPAESLPYVMEMLDILQYHNETISINPQVEGTYDPEWCDGIVAEFDTTIEKLYSKLGTGLDDMLDDIDIDEFRRLIYK